VIPILHNGRLIFCGPGQPIHNQHCPVCGDARLAAVMWVGRPAPAGPVANTIECPCCGRSSELWRLLDRRSS
jgi:hypothetical protein